MARSTGAVPAHVALLRGINVGGKNKLPMRDLAAIFADLGCADVRTYIQSGNVVFRAGPALARRIPHLVAGAVARTWRFEVPVVIRTAEELQAAAKHNPFLRPGVDPRSLHVAFLAARPSAARVGALDPERSPGDEFAVRGREILAVLFHHRRISRFLPGYPLLWRLCHIHCYCLGDRDPLRAGTPGIQALPAVPGDQQD